jgi:rubredoxin
MANYAPFLKEGAIKVNDKDFKSWMCIICGWVYEEEHGAPEDGLAPGTRWEDIPEYWVCPDCGAGKEDFEMIEI